MTVTAPAPFDRGAAVVALHWDQFLAWRRGELRTVDTAYARGVRLPAPPVPGQHEANVGPTGEGKTNHIVPLLKLRKYVMALDAKGQDDTLEKSGFRRVLRLDRLPRDVDKDLAEGRPVRLIVGGPLRTARQEIALQSLMQDALDFARYTGHWTVYADEFEVLSSQQMFNLAGKFNRMLNTARRDRQSVWTAYQAQAWVSKHAVRQARLATLWRTGDPDMIKAVARAMGRDWREVGPAVDALPIFNSLTIPRGANSGPMIVTNAPKL